MRARNHGLNRGVRNAEARDAIHQEVRPHDAPQAARRHGAGAGNVPNRARGGGARHLFQLVVAGHVGGRVGGRDGPKGVDHGGRLVEAPGKLDAADHEAGVDGVVKGCVVDNGLGVSVLRVQMDGAPAHALCLDCRKGRGAVERYLNHCIVGALY